MSCRLLPGRERRLIRWERNMVIQMSNRCLTENRWHFLTGFEPSPNQNSCKYLTASHTVRPVKLNIPWLGKKYPALCGPKHYYLAHKDPELTLSWATRIQSTTFCTLSVTFLLMLSSRLDKSIRSVLLPFYFFWKSCMNCCSSPLSTRPANLMLLFSIRTTGHAQKISNFLSWWRDVAFV